MSRASYWLKSGSFSMINRFVIFFFGFATYFLLVRYLDKSDFGVYSIYLIIVTLVEMSRNGFVQNGYIKYAIDKKFENDEVLTASFVLNIVITLFMAIVLFAISGLVANIYDSPALRYMIRVYCISSILIIPLSQILFYFYSKVKYQVVSIISFMRYGSYFFITLAVFFRFDNVSLETFSILHAVSVVIGLITSLFFLRLVEFSKFIFSRKLFVDLLNFGKYIFGVSITSIISKSIDQLMLGYFIGTEAVANYNVAVRFVNFIEVPLTSISQLVYPRIAETLNSGDPEKEQARMYEKSTGIILAAIAPFLTLLFLFPSFFISIVAGEKYLEAVFILQIFMVYNLIKPYAVQAGTTLEILGKPQIGFYVLLPSTFINVILNYILIPIDAWYGGMIGAAISTLISGTFFLSVALYYIHRSCKFSMIQSFKEFLLAYKQGTQLIVSKLFTRKIEDETPIK